MSFKVGNLIRFKGSFVRDFDISPEAADAIYLITAKEYGFKRSSEPEENRIGCGLEYFKLLHAEYGECGELVDIAIKLYEKVSV